MRPKIVYLENIYKRTLKAFHFRNERLNYRENPEMGFQYKVSIKGEDVNKVFQEELMYAGNISNINKVTSNINCRLVKVAQKKPKFKNSKIRKPRWKNKKS